MDVENRDDLIPSCCKGCVAEVVAGVHKGVPVYWVQHGTTSEPTVSRTGTEATARLEELHNQQTATEGDPATVIVDADSLIDTGDDPEGVPV